MKITQEKPEFKPITITLMTRDEAEEVWRAIRNTSAIDLDGQKILNEISDWFSQEAIW